MRMDKTVILFVISTVIALLSSIFWFWVHSIQKKQDEERQRNFEIGKKLQDFKDDVYQNYQTKDEAKDNFEQIMSSLRDIKADVHRISDKLDRKADK